MSNLRETTPFFGANAIYIAEVYEQYLRDPSSVDGSWREYFNSFGDSSEAIKKDFGGAPWASDKTKIVGYKKPFIERRKKAAGRRATDTQESSSASIRAHMLIRAYRVRGHLIANLDPLGLSVRQSHPELEIERYGFSEKDMGQEIFLGGWLGREKATLREILSILKQSYSSNIGLEYIHIQSLEKKEWLENKQESSLAKPTLSASEKKNILKQLIEVIGFQEFLHIKFPGAKRFSAEGGDNLLPAMEAVATTAAKLGVKEVVVGMPHRGRLSVLTAFMGKPYAAMLSEFQGNLATPDYINSSGDVKYHLGISADKKFEGEELHLSLTANPSHLEAVNPVVVGKVRAKQDQHGDVERNRVMGLLLHGDAAFCGQGVVAETLSLSDLDGYKTGGTVHIVVNNQIGFTANPNDAHKSPYPTDVAMMIQAPIFHVNGDDPEAVVHASRIAAEYRQKFKKDVILDIWCYRRYGHNEGDEPMFTQPSMYKKIAQMPTARDIYAERLISEGIIGSEEFDKLKKEFHSFLEREYETSKNYKPNKADMLEGKWEGIEQANDLAKTPKAETGIDIKILKKIGKKLSDKPDGFNLNKKVERMLDAKHKMIETGEGIDWATAEALAFGSLLIEGHSVRLSGQDVMRGTFSHRHSGLVDQDNENIFYPLNNIEKEQGRYEAINSNLSEFAVLGYEYGYSSAEPKALTLWEAQFGDFSNGAQIIIDQFIASAEVKWLRMSGLVMLLPHGYEGQGPEHSSARLERFLQLSAEDNWQVANCTTPANYFHILRRQLKRNFRKPLILMTPKSLLRHKLATSKLSEMAKGTTFRRVLPETEKLAAHEKIRKVVICSGKIYYDLFEERANRKIKDIAIIRLEQFYPFPEKSLFAEVKKYKNAEVIWCQEEPENMGGWNFVDRRIEKVLLQAKIKAKRPQFAGRKRAAATAAGYMKIHEKEQNALINEAMD